MHDYPTLHQPTQLVADLCTDQLEEQDAAFTADADAERAVDNARADLAALKNDTTTDPAELHAKREAAKGIVAICEERRNLAARNATRAAGRVRGAEQRALLSDEGTRRRRDLVTERATKFAAVTSAASDLTNLISEIADDESEVINSLDAERKRHGGYVAAGAGALSGASAGRQLIAEAVNAVRPMNRNILAAIARNIAGEDPYDKLADWSWKPSELSEVDREAVVNMLPAHVGRRWLDSENDPATTPNPKPKRKARAL